MERRTYSSSRFNFDLPYLLDVQVNSFNRFIQQGVLPKERKIEGLQKIFSEVFPITDIKEMYSLEYEGYSLGVPKYSIEECQKRGMTFAAPLKATLSLNIFEGEGEEKKFVENKWTITRVCADLKSARAWRRALWERSPWKEAAEI